MRRLSRKKIVFILPSIANLGYLFGIWILGVGCAHDQHEVLCVRDPEPTVADKINSMDFKGFLETMSRSEGFLQTESRFMSFLANKIAIF